MERLIIKGNNPLGGELVVQGAKNAVLPIMAASILAGDKCILTNCPRLSDVEVAVDILRALGCDAQQNKDRVTIDSSCGDKYIIPCNLMCKMRSSVMFLGAMLGAFKKAVITHPGGCDLGQRPIDMHIKALRELGVEIQEEQGILLCFCDKIKPCEIVLDFPSVGVTENVILASCLARGRTVLKNAAREPEIEDLQNFINAMGGKVFGAGTGCIVIDGVERLKGVSYKIMPDRIASATYLGAVAVCGGEIKLENGEHRNISAYLKVLESSGCRVEKEKGRIMLSSKGLLTAQPLIETAVYPGFPTDAQPVITALMCCARGRSVVRENIFTDRLRYCNQLKKMGADINVVGNGAYINGVEELKGSSVYAEELRGGAALVLAGLKARGTTEIFNVNYIDRGYESIETVFKKLGAEIRRIKDEK